MQLLLTGFFVLVRIFSNSLSNVFQKKLAQQGEIPVCINFINYLLLSIISIPALFFINSPKLNLELIIFALLGGICGALCNYFIVEALKYGELSVLGPINSYKTVIALFFGIILLKEIPNFWGLIGIILILAGSYFIFDTFNFLEIFKRKEIQYRFYALFFSALEAIFIKKVILLSSISISFITSNILGALFAYFLIKGKHTAIKPSLSKRNLTLYVLTAVCFGLMTYSTAIVFNRINVSYALSLFQLSIFISVLFGWKIFKEKNIIKKLIGAAITILGAVCVIFSAH